MSHTSIKLDTPCEFINVVPINPLISKCQIKVCYVQDTPNRNKSVITKETARQLANSLPGSPIVGYYLEDEKDFDRHTKQLRIKDGKIEFTSLTRPYGFVDLNARCWFQKYLDDNVNEHEYLVTEGYLWTGQYPECKRILERGNNQSMELDKKIIDAHWTKDVNGEPQFFIINEALISKLCILGEDQEPCFEGSSIGKIEFSFTDSFKEELSQMISQLQEYIDKGGTETVDKKEEVKVCPECGKPIDECICDEKKEDKTQYDLADVVEYQELLTNYSELEKKYNDLNTTKETLEQEVNSLREFKLNAEKQEKLNMIEQTFYMLSDEDKKDVMEHLDEYSLEEVESKLSVICVRNKVDFNLAKAEEKDAEEKEEPVSYNLNSENLSNSGVPGWVLAARGIKNR